MTASYFMGKGSKIEENMWWHEVGNLIKKLVYYIPSFIEVPKFKVLSEFQTSFYYIMFCEKKIRIWEKQVMSTLHDMWWHILCFALTVEHKCITLSSQTIRNQMPLNHNQNLKLLHQIWRRKFKPNLNLNWTFINTYHQIERI